MLAASEPENDSQKLVAVGTRTWGNWWDGRGLLKVRIYDFAIYVDSQKAHGAASAGKGRRRWRKRAASSDTAGEQSLYQSDSVPMSLMIRASRDLPIKSLSEEYERVLRRRLEKVGGNADEDPALQQVVDWLGERYIPISARSGANVRKGTTIAFEKGAGGCLTARVGQQVLGQVHSDKVCQALFDLYLGDQPVSRKAKVSASENLSRMLSDPRQGYRPAAGEKLECNGEGLEACVIQLKD